MQDATEADIRVLIADDEQPLREALAAFIDGEPGLSVVAKAASGDMAISKAREVQPDVAVLDVRIPGGGPATAAGIAEASPGTAVVALSVYDDRVTVLQMLRTGVAGYLVKGTSPDEIVDAIRRAVRQQASISRDMIGNIAEDLAREQAEWRESDQGLQRSPAERRMLLAHVVSASEEERRRIASDIHDDSIQAITAAGMRLQILRATMSDPDQLRLVDELEATIELSITRLRHLLFDLRPPALDTEGLGTALQMFLDEERRRGDTHYRLDDRLGAEPDAENRVTLYRIAKEALANVRKHACASEVEVSLVEEGRGYLLQVKDNGIGFMRDDLKSAPGHLGLAAMQERAELAGGWLKLDSRLGEGTVVQVWIPVARDAELESFQSVSASSDRRAEGELPVAARTDRER